MRILNLRSIWCPGDCLNTFNVASSLDLCRLRLIWSFSSIKSTIFFDHYQYIPQIWAHHAKITFFLIINNCTKLWKLIRKCERFFNTKIFHTSSFTQKIFPTSQTWKISKGNEGWLRHLKWTSYFFSLNYNWGY